MSYGKFFPSTFTGSMAGAGAHVFAVWGYCLANGYGGQVDLNPLVVSALIGCSRADVEAAIAYLCAPDPNSRSKQNEGRRLTHLTGVVYEIVNYDPYHRMATQESVREYHREKKRERRSSPTCPGHVPENGRYDLSSSDPDPERALPEADVEVTRILTIGADGPEQAQPSVPASKPKRKARPLTEVPLPVDWAPTDAHRAYAAKHALDVELEADALRGWAEGRTAISWNGTFATRLANSAKWKRGSPMRKAGPADAGEERFL